MGAARVFTPEFRVSVAIRLLNGESVSAVNNELKIKRSVLYRWRDAYRKEGADGLNRPQGLAAAWLRRLCRRRGALPCRYRIGR